MQIISNLPEPYADTQNAGVIKLSQQFTLDQSNNPTRGQLKFRSNNFNNDGSIKIKNSGGLAKEADGSLYVDFTAGESAKITIFAADTYNTPNAGYFNVYTKTTTGLSSISLPTNAVNGTELEIYINDNDLINKNIGTDYNIHITCEVGKSIHIAGDKTSPGQKVRANTAHALMGFKFIKPDDQSNGFWIASGNCGV